MSWRRSCIWDPFELRMKNIVREGDVMPAYYGQVNTSCALDRCLDRVKEMIDWDHKYPVRDMGMERSVPLAWEWRCRDPALRLSTWEVPRSR